MPAIDLQPTLEGPSVTIRPVRASDWADMYAAASDPGIWEQHPESHRHQEETFRRYFDGALASGSAFTFVDRESGTVIGSSRYHGFNEDKREIEIGWTFLARDYWGGSVNSEIKQLMLAHAFSFADVVVFWIGPENLRSRRATEKIGGVLRDGIRTRPESGDEEYVVYEIRRENWRKED